MGEVERGLGRVLERGQALPEGAGQDGQAAFSPAEVAAITGGVLVAGRPNDPAVRGAVVDSRAVRGGELFVALPGEKVDGHDFAGAALAAGAAGVLVRSGFSGSEVFRGLEAGSRPWFAVEVDDTLRGLQDLGRQWLSIVNPLVVAVTGSNGKTTTKDLLAGILGVAGETYKNEGNLNTEIGLPLSILGMPAATRRLVLEMGMRGRGQIAGLAALARPAMGVVTNVGLVHLELLGSQEEIALAKRELVEALPRNGVAVLNADDPLVLGMATHAPCPVVTFGLAVEPAPPSRVADGAPAYRSRGHVWADGVRDEGLFGLTATIHLPAHEGFEVAIPLPGRHNLMNALAAAAASWACGEGPGEIRDGLARASLSPMRGEVTVAPGGFTVVNDAYNASPASMEAAIALLASSRRPGGRVVAALADMLELGPASREAHFALGRTTAEAGLDAVYTTGPMGKVIAEGATAGRSAPERVRHFASREELAAAIRVDLAPGPNDVVLVKGSRGMGMEKVVALLLAAAAAPAGAPRPSEGSGAQCS